MFMSRGLDISVQSRVRTLALLMPVAMAGSLVALGLPFLQAPWWLAVSLAGYTLAGAVWGILLPRLRPAFAQSTRSLDSLHLAHGRAREACVNHLFATVEGVLMALFTPLIGWLIDESRSADTVLIIVDLVLAVSLACALLALGTSFQQAARTRRSGVSCWVSTRRLETRRLYAQSSGQRRGIVGSHPARHRSLLKGLLALLVSAQ
jgi:hypothetical protein